MLKFAVIAFALLAGVSAQEAVATASASAVGIASASASATATASSTKYHPEPKHYKPKYPKYYPKKEPSPKPVLIQIVDEPKPIVTKKEDDIILVIGEAEPAPIAECTTIAAAAAATPELSTLVAALEAAGLVEALSDPSLVATILAPTNDAFVKLLETFDATVEEVLADPQLANILLYHVIGDVAAKSSDLEDGLMLSTLLGQEIIVDLGDGVGFIGSGSDASVVVADIEACSAVIHVIDNVLLPDFDAISESATVSDEEPAVETTTDDEVQYVTLTI